MFRFKVFLLFWVRVARERVAEKKKYFRKRNVVSLVGFDFSQMWKINHVKATGSTVTSVLKKVVPTIRKSCDSYHETVVTAVIRQLLLWAEALRSTG